MIKIIIFGIGAISSMLSKNIKKDKAQIVCYAVSDGTEGKEIGGVPVVDIKKAVSYEYDYIVIAFSNIKKGFDILLDMGVERDKIIGYSFTGGPGYKDNLYQKKCDEMLHEELNDYKIPEIFNLPCKKQYLCSMYMCEDTEIVEKDFVREQTLVLIAKEINRKNLKGNVAELGVYKGDFSKKINHLFPQKVLYLFDTFEGFDTKDTSSDKYLNEYDITEVFLDSSVEYVLNQMPNKEKCIPKKGYFPDTFDLENEVFSFVSIDAALYAPTLSGLEIFYEHLEKGGYIMMHDYNLGVFQGTERAIIEYCDEHGISYVPIPDIAGTIIITK